MKKIKMDNQANCMYCENVINLNDYDSYNDIKGDYECEECLTACVNRE